MRASRRWSTALCRCGCFSAPLLDATRDRPGPAPDPEYAEEVRLATAALFSELAAVVRTFGDLIRDEIEEPEAPGRGRAHRGPHGAAAAPRPDRGPAAGRPPRRDRLWELNSSLLTMTDRMLAELDVVEHARLRAELSDAARARRRAEVALERIRDTAVSRLVAHEHDESPEA